MLILATFAAIALIAAGLFAVMKGDTFVMAALLVVLLLVVLVVAPQVLTIMHQIQNTMNAALPVALR
jgi:hypothetical protein